MSCGLERNSGSKWTDDDDSRLLSLKDVGKTNRAISDELCRSMAAVEQRLYILRDRAQLLAVRK